MAQLPLFGLMRAVAVVIAALLVTCVPVPPPPPEQLDEVLPPPSVPLSLADEQLLSSAADLAVLLPERWSILPASSALAEGTVGMALSPDVAMALIVQRIPPSQEMQQALLQRDWRALARACFERRLQRTGNTVRLQSDFRVLGYDSLRMGVYQFVEQTPDTAFVRSTRVAALSTHQGTVYEIALSPLSLTLDRVPSEHELDSTFRLILHLIRTR